MVFVYVALWGRYFVCFCVWLIPLFWMPAVFRVCHPADREDALP